MKRKARRRGIVMAAICAISAGVPACGGDGILRIQASFDDAVQREEIVKYKLLVRGCNGQPRVNTTLYPDGTRVNPDLKEEATEDRTLMDGEGYQAEIQAFVSCAGEVCERDPDRGVCHCMTSEKIAHFGCTPWLKYDRSSVAPIVVRIEPAEKGDDCPPLEDADPGVCP